MKVDLPFDPPYRTFSKTKGGIQVVETLADGTELVVDANDFISQNKTSAQSEQTASFTKSLKRPTPFKEIAPSTVKALLFLEVPFADKDKAKSKGARWDATAKKWYVPHGIDINPFEKWWPTPIKIKMDTET